MTAFEGVNDGRNDGHQEMPPFIEGGQDGGAGSFAVRHADLTPITVNPASAAKSLQELDGAEPAHGQHTEGSGSEDDEHTGHHVGIESFQHTEPHQPHEDGNGDVPRAGDAGSKEPPGPPLPPTAETGPGPEENPEDTNKPGKELAPIRPPFGVEHFDGIRPANEQESAQAAELLRVATFGLTGMHSGFMDIEVTEERGSMQIVQAVTRLQHDAPEGTTYIEAGAAGLQATFVGTDGRTSYNHYYTDLADRGVRKDTRDMSVTMEGLPADGEVPAKVLWGLRAQRLVEAGEDATAAKAMGIADPLVSLAELKHVLTVAIEAHPETKTYTDVLAVTDNNAGNQMRIDEGESAMANRELAQAAATFVERYNDQVDYTAEREIANADQYVIIDVTMRNQDVDEAGSPVVDIRYEGWAGAEEWDRELIAQGLEPGSIPPGIVERRITYTAHNNGVTGTIDTVILNGKNSGNIGIPKSDVFVAGASAARTLRNFILGDLSANTVLPKSTRPTR